MNRYTSVLPERLLLGSPGAVRPRGHSRRLGQLLAPSRITADPTEAQAVIAWGLKSSSEKAARAASRHGLPLWRVEDAFLRSVCPRQSDPALGMVFDDLGIYYDADRESRLERLILQTSGTADYEERAAKLIRLWRKHRVSKYNHAREFSGPLPENYVLVVDQTLGDLSIRHGRGDPSVFDRMLEAALKENPDDHIVLKVHPLAAKGTKPGHFNLEMVSRERRLCLIAEDTHLVRCIEQAKKVYTVTSQAGFEALLWGKAVRTFGMPFYAGWGLTEDAIAAPSRRRRCPLGGLVHAALVDYARYVNPETGQQCEPEEIIEYLGVQREIMERYPAYLAAPSLSLAKRAAVKRFFPYSQVNFKKGALHAKNTEAVLVWGRSRSPHHSYGKPVIRLEDGFVRSAGLGSAFTPAASWVADRTGIYFDASRPSDLESILQTAVFTPELRSRARSLIEAIISARLTKYNVGSDGWTIPDGVGRVVLVPGQVEDDASVTWGSSQIRTNIALLRAVRERNPDAYLLYKPHPDVIAGSRYGGDGAWLDWADSIADRWVSLDSLFPMVHEVHTMTSLAGFEALLRGKSVTVHGMPFYAGWGLTSDIFPAPDRRARFLSLEELVAGALILYPLYLSAATGRPTTPERVVQEMAEGLRLGAAGILEALLAQFKKTTTRWSAPSEKTGVGSLTARNLLS